MNPVYLHLALNYFSLGLVPIGLIIFFIAIKKTNADLRRISLYVLIIGNSIITANSHFGEKAELKNNINIITSSDYSIALENHRTLGTYTFFLSLSVVIISILALFTNSEHLGLSILLTIFSMTVIYTSFQCIWSGILLSHSK